MPAAATAAAAAQSNFNLGQCDDAKATAYLALLGMGAGFRLLAFAFLKYTCSKKH